MTLPLDRLLYALDVITGQFGAVPAGSLADAKAVYATTKGWVRAEGVTGLGVAYRTVQGRKTSDFAVKLYVLGKKPMGEVAQPAPRLVEVPDLNEPVPIDVEVLEAVELHAGPVRGGAAVWNSADYENQGTLACLATSKDAPGRQFGLSATHVLAHRNPAPADEIYAAGTDGPLRIGRLHKWAQINSGLDYPNLTDAALVALETGAADAAIESLGIPTGVGYFVDCGDELRSYGAVSREVRRGEVLDVNFRGPIGHSIDGVESNYWFRDLILCTALSQGGDSGAAVLDASGKIIGLVTAGNAAVSMLGSMKNVIEALKVDIVTSAAPFAPAVVPPVPPSSTPPRVGDRAAALDVLARTLWGEARGEEEKGMRAVASVIANRANPARPRWWGKTVEEVCQFGDRYKQFSCWNDDDPNYWKLRNVTPADPKFSQCLTIAAETLDGRNKDETHGATHYYAVSMPAPPKWAEEHRPCYSIGHHRFFNDIP